MCASDWTKEENDDDDDDDKERDLRNVNYANAAAEKKSVCVCAWLEILEQQAAHLIGSAAIAIGPIDLEFMLLR